MLFPCGSAATSTPRPLSDLQSTLHVCHSEHMSHSYKTLIQWFPGVATTKVCQNVDYGHIYINADSECFVR